MGRRDAGSLSEALRRRHLIFLDTMIFAYHFRNDPYYQDAAATALSLVESGAVPALTTTVTLAELLAGPAFERDEIALRHTMLRLRRFPNLRIVPLDTRIAARAARVRAATRLKLPDAIQIATAIEAGADAILTNDAAWRGRTGPVELLLLEDFVER